MTTFKKALIALISAGTLIASCTAACFVGYHQGYNHVIHNQYAEECPDDPNCYHIIIDGNIHEYEVDNTTISTTGTFTFYDYTYNFTSNDGTLTWSFDKDNLDFKPTANQQYTLTYSDNGTADVYDDIFISVTETK